VPELSQPPAACRLVSYFCQRCEWTIYLRPGLAVGRCSRCGDLLVDQLIQEEFQRG